MIRLDLHILFLAVVTALGFSPIAEAHYSPTLGRWAERDPVGPVDGPSLLEFCRSNPLARSDPRGLLSSAPGGQDVDTEACNNACKSAFDPKTDPQGYANCMVGCVNGQRGVDCFAYCLRFPDPIENASCLAGCNAGQGRQGGGCVVACPVQGGPPIVLAGACAVAIAVPEPLASKGAAVVIGTIICGCIAYELLAPPRHVPVDIPRIEPIRVADREGRSQRWKCTIKPRGVCPPQCQSRFIGVGATREIAERSAREQCYAAKCHQTLPEPYNCNCGHVTCWRLP